MVLGAQASIPAKLTEALQVLTLACEGDRSNPQLHFQRAHVLLAAGQLAEAQTELEAVRDLAPREAPVRVLLAQVSQQRGRLGDCLAHCHAALALDPKTAAALKPMLDSLNNSSAAAEEEGGASTII